MSKAFYICNHDGLVLQYRKQIGNQYLIETDPDKIPLWVTNAEYNTLPEGHRKCDTDVKDTTIKTSLKSDADMFYICNQDGLVLQVKKRLAVPDEGRQNIHYLIEIIKDKTHRFVTQEEFETIPEGCMMFY